MKRLMIMSLGIFLFVIAGGFKENTQGAEQYPVKPIVYVFPVTPGSGQDINMRPLLQKASSILGKSIVGVYKPGAGHTIAYREVYGAKPDGYTIGGFLETILTAKLQGLFPIDYHNFTFLAGLYTSSPVVVAATKTQHPFKTIKDVFDFAKSHSGEVSIATTPVGQSWWIASCLFQEGSGLAFNIVPQEGGSSMAVTQVAGGHADLAIVDLASAKPQIDNGNLSLLAIVGPQRVPGEYSNTPTLKELGYEISFRSITGIIGPPKMPKDIVNKLIKTLATAFTDQEWQKHIIARNNVPSYMTPEESIKYLETERKSWAAIMEKVGILKEK